jgi:MFS family permease
VASFTFISPVSSSIVAPATQKISESFVITNFAVSQISYSVFVLGYAFGPLFLSPLSEIYGRSRLLQLANLFYLIFNTVAGFSRNTGELIAFRFLSGLGGSAPLAVFLTFCSRQDKANRNRSVEACSATFGSPKNVAQLSQSTL